MIIYTCLVGKRDQSLPKMRFKDDVRYIAFTDRHYDSTEWEIHNIGIIGEPTRTARYYKHNPQWVLPRTQYSIWIDSSHIQIKSFISLLDFLNQCDIGAMRHPFHQSVYEELKLCNQLRLDSNTVMTNQLSRYEVEGFPDEGNFFCTGLLVRRHTKELLNFQDLWWKEIQKGSKRDQLSFTYCLWKKNMQAAVIPGKGWLSGQNEYFDYIPHGPNKHRIKFI